MRLGKGQNADAAHCTGKAGGGGSDRVRRNWWGEGENEGRAATGIKTSQIW